ncbi:major facilitator superfamily domain-containing protein [Syncephalastrum racemosum]|uniref:Major facilitator superfamily domain-containing protein n=1 Tax=Syncephalastrum racemosum TaxID=13706 RepID=A0A1X2HEA8_SYNRA|nr:major facilitator superfamily domain-containing protein [Syncephalastrum racemosum]
MNSDKIPDHDDRLDSEDSTTINEQSTDDKDEDNNIPDGGQGWAVVAAGFLSQFIMFGTSNIWGLFAQAQAETVFKGRASTTALMSVGSMYTLVTFGLTPIATMLADRFGARTTFALGGILMTLAEFLSACATEVWHLYLTQGVLFGFGSAISYMAMSCVIPQWFSKKRGAAMGIISAGAGLGGLAESSMVGIVIDRYGIPWAFRSIGFLSLLFCGTSIFLFKERVPRKRSKDSPIKSPIKLSTFNSSNFIIWIAAAAFAVTASSPPLFYLPKYAASVGVSTATSSNLMGIHSAVSSVGRFAVGYIGDKIGRINAFIIATTMAGLCCFLLWPFATTYNSLLCFVIVWGSVSHTYYSLSAPITASIVDKNDIASAFGIVFVVSSVASAGVPIATIIESASPSGLGYLSVQMFSGALSMCAILVCLILRTKLAKGRHFSAI